MDLIERDAALDAIFNHAEEIQKEQGTAAEKCYELIRSIPNKMEWNDAVLRRPRSGQRVLLTDGIFVGEGYIDDEGNWKRYYEADLKEVLGIKVTHWMPLPTPPKHMR